MPQKIQTGSSISIAANDQNDNVLSNTKVENVPADDDYRVTFSATGSATGLQHTFEVDNDTPIRESLVSAQNRVPLVPDDFIDEFDVKGGSKLYLVVENTTGAALTYFYRVTLTPLSSL